MAEAAVGPVAFRTAQAQPALAQPGNVLGGDGGIGQQAGQQQVKNRSLGVHHTAGQAAYWATERATPEEIAELESILKQEGLSLKDIHTRFHNGVTALSKNPILIHMLAEFQEQFKKQRELNFVILPDEDRLEHWKVLEAIKSGSPAKARRAMHQHIDYIWKKRPHLFPGKKGPDKM